MKYTISQQRLMEFIDSFLKGFLSKCAIYSPDSFILISQKVGDDDDSWVEYMEYDYSDGRLWVNKEFTKRFIDLFNFGIEDTRYLIKRWFEKEFDVEVKFVE